MTLILDMLFKNKLISENLILNNIIIAEYEIIVKIDTDKNINTINNINLKRYGLFLNFPFRNINFYFCNNYECKNR